VYFIRAARVYTPSEVIKDGWVLVDEHAGIIREVGQGALADENLPVVNVPDGFLCPGFVDIHVHGGGGKDPVGAAYRWVKDQASSTSHDGVNAGCGSDTAHGGHASHTPPRAHEPYLAQAAHAVHAAISEKPDLVWGSLFELAQYEVSTGVTSFLPTTGAVPRDVNLAVISQAFEFRHTSFSGSSSVPEESLSQEQEKIPPRALSLAQILGVNLEGPFISAKRKGAQPEEFIAEPSLEEAKILVETFPGIVRMMSLAPERPGAIPLIKYLREKGTVISMGHSDASYEEAMNGIEAGISHVTHVFSAMRGFHHREPGALGAALTDDRVTCELILDGIHAHPVAARLLIKLKGFERVCLITDGISAAGLPDGEYTLYGAPVRVVEGAARLSDGVLAGSTLRMDRAVKNMVEMVGTTLGKALSMATENPARVLGVSDRKGTIARGKDADLVILRGDLSVKETYIRGRLAYPGGSGARAHQVE